ncbi:UROD/MetE-like protein [Gloeophyllum trabeum ATCC 11539]|uniref:UROD/MetE-like protein n=1 Tax=Gloeophyllum trabeum (strain ATCC 11539 / FP-39264 / Madison 617) TaxID=670483 RepID=S7QM69_GLOTA|nr:UROD/MetE-like protein [Gloeophyllum trabeum ATCC 11539]EPQ60558.1 UROD/MetE-like protein [Gloeophyllum trabeum ATCC 11539]
MSPRRLNPPFRAEHIGSLLRPSDLFDKRQKFEAGQCTQEELKAAEDAAIEKVVQSQQEVGIKAITDGELRRGFFFEGVFDKLEGMTFIPNRPLTEFKPYVPFISMLTAAGMKDFPTVYCTGKIRRTKPWYAEQFMALRSLVPQEDIKNLKITMCPPTWFHQRHGSDLTYDLSVYNSDEEYFNDLAKAYQEEIQDLYRLGCRNIQFDDATFCFFCDERMVSGMKEAGDDFDYLLDTYIKAINSCLKERPVGMTVGVHMCRGNFKGGLHYAEGGYARIAEKVFTGLDVDCFYLEYDTERAGDFGPLKYLPLDKVAVLGLVTTKSPELESKEALKRRIHEAAQIISKEGIPTRSRETALDQLCISPQCGFASVWEGNPLTEKDQWEKLRLVVDTAKEVWGVTA